MSTTDRQNRLLVAEDWKRIYQSFQNADFQSYDFENLRRVMINYIRTNYPEDFNDYIESSEYLALIDLIAFLGQSIAFRVDLNSRDNFLELSERRDSVLRLARLLSYKVKRNVSANGLLKFSTISTTQSITDSNGRNLAGQTISWNDPSNVNWYDQFIKILNSALPPSSQFGDSDAKDTIYGIPTELYRFQTINSDVPVFNFSKTVDGRSMGFEIVSTSFVGKKEIYEEPPKLGNRLAFIYRDDGKGNGSANTGFFLHFRQGTLSQGNFTLTQPAPDETVDIDAANINETDVWLYQLDKDGNESDLWEQVPNFEGNNIIYNSLNKNIKNLYGVITRTNDKISFIFSDGVFGNLPQGSFRTYYRTSNGLSYTINPKDIKNVSLTLPYVSNLGQIEKLTLTLNLQSSISNSSSTETNDSIKSRAPATYYTQNRMITAEDYNISPLSVNQEVVKVKAVNRSSSGISRYFDLVDPTGKYSKTNLFADDGVLYRQTYTDSIRFKFSSRTDIEAIIYNQIVDILKLQGLKHFYYANFDKKLIPDLIRWNSVTVDTNQTSGYFTNSLGTVQEVGRSTSQLRFSTVGAMLKFKAPPGKMFDRKNNNAIIDAVTNSFDTTDTLWTKVISVTGSGTGTDNNGLLIDASGAIILNDIVPNSAELKEIIPAWRSTIEQGTIISMIDLIFSNKPFGLRYDVESRTWKIISETNLNIGNEFSLGRQGDISNQKVDSSWLLLFTTDTEFYTIRYRMLRYVFESEQQVRFFYDSSDKIYDIRNNTIVKDKIKILNINTDPSIAGSTTPFTYDRDWEIIEDFKGLDGYVDSKKIQVSFYDSDDDGIVDDPTLFEQIVRPDLNNLEKFIILEKYKINQGQEDYRYIENKNNKVIIVANENQARSQIGSVEDGQCFYFVDRSILVKLVKSSGDFLLSNDYKVYVGRDKIKFQYIHNADYEARIDPGLTNLIDVYVLTKQYDIEFRQWINGTTEQEPLPPSNDFLFNLLSPELNKIKSISDEIVYSPVKYKILFGSKASQDVQALFKVVKNSEVVISDNDVKTRVLEAISEFFALENWDFGDNFYFSELSAYVMNRLAPNITNFTIVPKQAGLTFGSLFEIRSEKDQIFISGASIDDIEIISSITASSIKSFGQIENENTIISQQSIRSSGSN